MPWRESRAAEHTGAANPPRRCSRRRRSIKAGHNLCALCACALAHATRPKRVARQQQTSRSILYSKPVSRELGVVASFRASAPPPAQPAVCRNVNERARANGKLNFSESMCPMCRREIALNPISTCVQLRNGLAHRLFIRRM